MHVKGASAWPDARFKPTSICVTLGARSRRSSIDMNLFVQSFVNIFYER
jgi:hypothetical protein